MRPTGMPSSSCWCSGRSDVPDRTSTTDDSARTVTSSATCPTGSDRVDRRRERGAQFDALLLHGLEARQFERHGVFAGAQVDDAVPAVVAGDGGLLAFDQGGAGHGDRHAWQRAAGTVPRTSDDRGRGRLGGCRGGEQARHGEHERERAEARQRDTRNHLGTPSFDVFARDHARPTRARQRGDTLRACAHHGRDRTGGSRPGARGATGQEFRLAGGACAPSRRTRGGGYLQEQVRQAGRLDEADEATNPVDRR